MLILSFSQCLSLSVSLPLSLSFFVVLSPWTLFFSSQFLSFSSSFSLSITSFFSRCHSLWLSVVFLPHSFSLSDPQALASRLLHLSVSAEKSPQLRPPHTGDGCRSVLMTASDICTCFCVWGSFRLHSKGGLNVTRHPCPDESRQPLNNRYGCVWRVKIEWHLTP